MREKGFNINSILLAVVIGMGGWGLKKAQEGGESIAVLNASYKTLGDNLMPRQEIQVRLNAIEAAQTDCRARIAALELEAAARKNHN